MIRFVFRVLALFALAVAVVMAVLDATRSIGASRLMLTPLGESSTQLQTPALHVPPEHEVQLPALVPQ